MSATPYGPFWADALTAYLSGKTVKALLLTDGYTFDKDHHHRDDLTNELVATGYTSGGVTLASASATYDATNNRIVFDANDANFGTLTTTSGIVAVVPYIAVGSAATDLLIAYHSFSPQTPSGVPFTYAWNADDGVGYLPV